MLCGVHFATECYEMPPDHLLTVHEAADLLGVQPRTLYKWASEGRLPVVKLGRLTRFRASVIEKLIEVGDQAVTQNASWSSERWRTEV